MSGWQAYLEGLYPDVLAPADLKQATAAGLTRLLLSESYAGADLVSWRGGNAVHADANLLIVDVHVDLGQREYRADIRAVERVGIIYVAGDMLPAVYPLRDGFPCDLPHLNISFKGTPQSLCLFEMDGEEALRLAVPFVLIERVRFWMRETAYGRLHGDDQPLDPVIMSTGQVIVLPLPGQAEEASPVFYGFRASDHPGCPAILLPPAAVSVGMRARSKNGFSAIHVTTEPLPNGRIRNYPRNVAELVDIYSELNVDLVPVLRAALGRTASVFLNPSGSDLVILREGAFREPRLDHVEMSYYWAAANIPDLEDHLADGRVGLFPSGGCRRASLRLPQSSVGLLASLAAQRLLRDECPEKVTAEVWRTSPAGAAVHTLPTDRYREAEIDGWTISVSERVIAGLGEARRAASPCETGGIVVGTWDRVRKRAYVAGHCDPPPDSVGTRSAFVRGAVGVYRTLESVSLRTAGNLGYVGEWHTHPPGHSSDPSPDDAILLEWIGDVLIYSDVAPLMLIAGEDGVRLLMGMRSRSAVMPYTHVKAAQCADGAALSCKSQTERPTPPC